MGLLMGLIIGTGCAMNAHWHRPGVSVEQKRVDRSRCTAMASYKQQQYIIDNPVPYGGTAEERLGASLGISAASVAVFDLAFGNCLRTLGYYEISKKEALAIAKNAKKRSAQPRHQGSQTQRDSRHAKPRYMPPSAVPPNYRYRGSTNSIQEACDDAERRCKGECSSATITDQHTYKEITWSDFDGKCEDACRAGKRACEDEDDRTDACYYFKKRCNSNCPNDVYDWNAGEYLLFTNAEDACEDACRSGHRWCD